MFTILASTIGIGAFYCFLGYATVTGWGFSDAATFADEFSNAKDPFFTLGTRAFGLIGPWLIMFAIANTTFGGAISAYNCITRVFYSLGRAGVFPKWLNYISPTTQTPTHAIYLENGASIWFTRKGWQAWTQDLVGNKTVFAYGGPDSTRLLTITDPAGLFYELQYNSATAPGQVTDVFLHGAGGTVDRVLTEGDSDRVTHLIVRRGSLLTREIAVPAELIATTDEQTVHLTISQQELDELPEFQEEAPGGA